MFTVSMLSRLSCRLGASTFSVRGSGVSITGYVACVGFRSFSQARLLAKYAAPRLPSGCKGVLVRRKGGLWWVSVPVTAESVPEEVALGGAVCAVGSPPDVRRVFAASGRG